MEPTNSAGGLGNIKKYNEDDFIFYEGECGNEMFVILSGSVVVYLNSFDSFPIEIARLSTGEFFGEMSILENQPRSATVVALENTSVLAINKDKFEAFICKQPTIAHKIMKALSSRVRHLNNELYKKREASGDILHLSSGKNISPVINKAEDNIQNHLRSGIFPDGHKSYSSIAPESHRELIFDKEIKCPLCGKSFNTKMQKLSKLKLDRIDYDFRYRYKDFEPLWYSIWSCPHCRYTSFYNEFDSIRDKAIKPLQSMLCELNGAISVNLKSPLEINQVFALYYLTLACVKVAKPEPINTAKIWMRLSWLYKDVDDEQMYDMASSNALEAYFEALYNSTLRVSLEQEQQICLILGELFLIKGKKDDALKHFSSAIRRNGGKPSFNQQAQDRIHDLRKEVKA